MYRPLPDCVTIKNSDIDGLGLFAVKDIAKGTNLGVSHRKVSAYIEVIRTPLGGFYNHSESPNCKKLVKGPISSYSIELVTILDIKADEELTVKYTLYKVGE
jgi:SET domain-containing protein